MVREIKVHWLGSVVVLFAVGVFSAPLLGQDEKGISQAEFNAVWTRACERTKNRPQIETETDEQYYDDARPPFNTYISVTRYLPPDRVWVVAGRKGAERRYEEIRIGRKSYSRDGDDPWKVQELGFSGMYSCEPEDVTATGKGNGSGGISDGNALMRFEYEYKRVTTKGSPDYYIRIKRMIILSGGHESVTTFKHRYGLNREEAFLKSESETRTSGTPRWSRKLREYDYSPKDLRIEAPIK